MNNPYPKYKPSGVDWLGDVPDHWEIKRLKYCASTIMGQSPNSDEYSDDADLLPFLQGNADFTYRYPSPHVYCESANKKVPTGSLLISVRAPVGALNEADQEYGIGRGLCAVIPRTRLDKRFSWFSIQITRTELSTLATGSTYDAVSADEVGNMLFPLPPLPEQQAIAAFLDRETGRIDALIAKKQRLLELLAEQRTAMISHAVTKGLDESVKMKPSGVDWLGDVPEHWEVKKLSWLFSYSKGTNAALLTKDYIGQNQGDYPVFSGQTENDGLMGEIDWYDFDFKMPVIFITTVGAKAMSTRIVKGKFSLSQNCALAIPRKTNIVSEYYEGVLRPLFDYEKRSISLIMQPSLRFEDLNRFRVPLPPLPEQQAIADFLDRETSKIDALSAKVTAVIEKLKEYRTALISAAVTGKIDVREAV
jgi:type I restriction enzyme S subunit